MLKTKVTNPIVAGGKTGMVDWIVVPGIGPGVAYVADDTMGTQFRVPLGTTSGIIQTVLIGDMDKERLGFEILFFREPITQIADNAPFQPSDVDRTKFAGHITVLAGDYAGVSGFADNAFATLRNVGFAFVAPAGWLIAQLVTRGAPNYTAATDLSLAFIVLQD